MKRCCFLLLLSMLLVPVFAQQDKQHDWAQFYRYENDNNKAMTQHPQVVFMGNSLTDHWVEKRPEFFNEHNFVGRGISGQTSSEMLVRFQADVISLKPKAVVILAGTNDIAQNNGQISYEHIVQNIQSMCELAKVHHIKPILCSLPPSIAFFWRPGFQPADSIVALNTKLQQYARKNHIMYVDYWSELVANDRGMRPEYTIDGCHLTHEGYSVMEEIIIKALRKAGIK